MIENILELLNEKKIGEIGRLLKNENPIDLAELFEEIPIEDLSLIFRILPKELAANTFVEMNGDMKEELIKAFSDNELKDVLDELYLDDTVDIIEEMPANVVKRILKHTNPETRKIINEILNYPKDSAGSIMTIEYVDLKKNMTVEDAFNRIRLTGVDKETIYTCYVIENNRKLIGLVSVRTLLLSNKSDVIEDIMEKNIMYVDTLEDKEQVAIKFDRYDYLAIPVVDQENCLVGIITVDDAMDVMREENTEDFTKMAAISPSEDSYFRTPIWKHAKNRILWLLFLMLSSTITGALITSYEQAFAAIPLLVSFIPMLMDTGGNCGSQSSTMIIRGLALEEIQLKDFFKAFMKETGIALVVGIALSVVNGIRIILFYHNIKLAIVLGITLLITVWMAKILGCVLPMLAKLLKMDPAIMAAPIITTIVDTCSVLVYFNVAIKLFNL